MQILKTIYGEIAKVVINKVAVCVIGFLMFAVSQMYTHYRIDKVEKKVFTLEYMNSTAIEENIEEQVIKKLLEQCGMFSSFLWTQYYPQTHYLHFKKVIFRDDVGISDVRLTTEQFNQRLIGEQTFQYFNNLGNNKVDFIVEGTTFWDDPLLDDYKHDSWEATNQRLDKTLNASARKRIMAENNGAIHFKLGSLYAVTIKKPSSEIMEWKDRELTYVLFLSLPNERKACFGKLGAYEAKIRTIEAMLDAKKQIENQIFNQIVV